MTLIPDIFPSVVTRLLGVPQWALPPGIALDSSRPILYYGWSLCPVE